MQASGTGIDIGSSALAVLVAFAGDSDEQSRAFFKVKGKKLLAAATSKKFSIELEGTASADAEQGEWPIHKSFLSDLAKVTVDGSPKVPAIDARLLLERTGVSRADLVIKSTGARCGGHDSDVKLPQNMQLTFKQIHDTIDVDFKAEGSKSWFPLEKKAHRALGAVYSAAAKNTPVSIVSGGAENSPVGFQAQGDGFVMRGIFVPPAVQGPGKSALEDDGDDADEGDEERAPKRDRRSQTTLDELAQRSNAATADTDGAVISDEEAAALKAEQAGDEPPPLATEKPKKGARKSKAKG